MYNQTRSTAIFILFLLLAGVTNLFSRGDATVLSLRATLMTCLSYMIYIGLLLSWLESVRVRLLPSDARNCIMGVAVVLLIYMLLRIFKYRLAVGPVVQRYAVYAYWIPQMLAPALFLMAILKVRSRGLYKAEKNENLPLIPGILLSLLVMTNDFHFLVYVPHVPLSEFKVETGTYTYGPAMYFLYVWMVLAVVGVFVIFFREAGRVPRKAVRDIIVVIFIWMVMVFFIILVADSNLSIRMYNVPEIHIFSMLAIAEICIRSRLVPCNENYPGFFRKLRVPSLITDRQLFAVYRSEAGLPAKKADLEAALSQPKALTPDLKLFGREVRAGYAFWAEDESAVHLVRDRLLEANELIEQENDLIRAETEQKEKDAYLRSRHHIYHEIAAELYPCQKRIGRMLDEAVPGTDGFRDKLAEVSVLNAYVKRKTNLLLLAEENEDLALRELYFALQESANYLTLAGLQTYVGEIEDRKCPAETVISIYDAFEFISEQLIGRTSSLMVSWNGNGLRLTAETDLVPEAGEIALPVRFRTIEGVLFADVLTGEGDEQA